MGAALPHDSISQKNMVMTRLSWFLCSLDTCRRRGISSHGPDAFIRAVFDRTAGAVCAGVYGSTTVAQLCVYDLGIYVCGRLASVPVLLDPGLALTAILIVPLIQIIMFGMGTTLSVADFTRVLRMPWPVFIGISIAVQRNAAGRLLASRGTWL